MAYLHFDSSAWPPASIKVHQFMTFISTAQHIARISRADHRGHLVPILFAGAIAAGAIGLVAFLLWPTWEAEVSSGPERLPVSIGGTLFNVPAAAIRMNIQRHSGPQERVDLSFSFPSLEPPEPPKHVSAGNLEVTVWSSVLGEAHEAARVHRAFRRHGGMAARGASAENGDAGDWVPQQRIA